MKSAQVFVLVLAIALVLSAVPSSAACSNTTIKGSYGFLLTGTNSTSLAAVVGQITADGSGGLTGSETISNNGVTEPDAYKAETTLGDILRYLKCCKGDGTPRYPNLKQVFLATRIYGGYANGTGVHGCTNPEPYAYELGFAIQRLIVSQINGTPDPLGYSGPVDYTVAPWFDWGPYLWADGENPRSDGLNWCNGQGDQLCPASQRDVRYGDPNNQIHFWGDFTHPTAAGAQKVANQLVNFFTKSAQNGGSPFVQSWNQQ
jgi:hypothetical protein